MLVKEGRKEAKEVSLDVSVSYTLSGLRHNLILISAPPRVICIPAIEVDDSIRMVVIR